MLSLKFCDQKIQSLTWEIEKHENSKLGYIQDYVKHQKRILKAYQGERNKALQRPQPEVWDEEEPIRGSYYRKEFETKIHEAKGWAS